MLLDVGLSQKISNALGANFRCPVAGSVEQLPTSPAAIFTADIAASRLTNRQESPRMRHRVTESVGA
jgi:hypothetical protein